MSNFLISTHSCYQSSGKDFQSATAYSNLTAAWNLKPFHTYWHNQFPNTYLLCIVWEASSKHDVPPAMEKQKSYTEMHYEATGLENPSWTSSEAWCPLLETLKPLPLRLPQLHQPVVKNSGCSSTGRACQRFCTMLLSVIFQHCLEPHPPVFTRHLWSSPRSWDSSKMLMLKLQHINL